MSIKVRLTRKFAQIINGIDLSRARAGEEIDLSPREAELLVAEGWASLIDRADDKPSKRRARKARRGPAVS
jgi:hypothetical protein